MAAVARPRARSLEELFSKESRSTPQPGFYRVLRKNYFFIAKSLCLFVRPLKGSEEAR